ncbi:hypothetical protein [Spirosoma litoris]
MDFSDHIRIKRHQDNVFVWSYYHPVFLEDAKSLQGEWRSEYQCWQFNSSVVSYLPSLLDGLFHVNGLTKYPVCRLRINSYSTISSQDACILFNRPVARAFSRDSGALIQPDIYKLNGVFRSGGSKKNWRTILEEASFEIHHFPLAALNREDVLMAVKQGWVDVLD